MTPRWALPAAVVAVPVLALAAVLVARLSGFSLDWPVALAIGLCVAALGWTGTALPVDDPKVPGPPERPAPLTGASFGDLAALRLVVQSDGADPQRFETRLRPRLAAVATERLWQHHGIDWRTEAGRAAAGPLLGPGVAALLTAAPGSLRLTPESLTSWIRELEAL